MKLILASSSPARRQLMAKLQLPFEIMPPDIDETPQANENAHELTRRLAQQKAQKVAKQITEPALILGCDQLGELDGQFLGKPHQHDEAVAMLKAQRNRQVTYFTSICLLNSDDLSFQLETETFEVIYRDYSDEDIEGYLQKEKPYGCAGALRIEGLGITLVDSLKGQDPNTLIGIPLIKLTTLLKNHQVNIYT